VDKSIHKMSVNLFVKFDKIFVINKMKMSEMKKRRKKRTMRRKRKKRRIWRKRRQMMMIIISMTVMTKMINTTMKTTT